jgi:hypothetical protein
MIRLAHNFKPDSAPTPFMETSASHAPTPAESAHSDALVCARLLRRAVGQLAVVVPLLALQLRRACADLILGAAEAHRETDPLRRGCVWAVALARATEVQALLEVVRARDLDDSLADTGLADEIDQAAEAARRLCTALPRLLVAGA